MSRYYQDLRFEKTYGLPAGRRRIAITSLENQYRIIKVIDKGGELGTFNAGVFLVENLQEKKLRVLKRIPPTTQMLEREILFLQVLNHPNIVGYRDAFITNDIPKSMGLYLEYCDGGSLADLINKYVEHNRGQAHRPPAYVPEAFAWHAIHSLANALQFIHHGIKSSDRRNPPVPMDPKNWPIILHRDLKPANIFLHYFPVPHGTRKRALLYPHGPFNHANPEYSMTTYPKLVLADFVSSVASISVYSIVVILKSNPRSSRGSLHNMTSQIFQMSTTLLAPYNGHLPNYPKPPLAAKSGPSEL